MQEIIHAFGIDWRLIVIQMFNFAVLMGALWYFLYTPVMNMLRERETKIQKGVEDAEAARKSLSEAETTKKQVLTEANTEATAVVKRAAVRAEEKSATIIKEAEERALRTLEEAKQKSAEIQRQAFKESEAEIAKVAVLTAEKLLRKELNV